jgi:two-component system CheB/CheR fusion protein
MSKRGLGSSSYDNFMRTRQGSVLVVDDYPDCADTLVELLRFCGFDAHACHSADAALTAACALRPQVVVLEPVMAGHKFDGYQLGSLLRQGRRPDEVLLVALTGRGLPGDRVKAIRAGFDAFLLKPSTPEAILTLITGWMGPSQLPEPAGVAVQCLGSPQKDG